MAMKSAFVTLLPFLAFDAALAQLATRCAPALTNVACVDKFAAVMPLPFARPTSTPGEGLGDLDRFSNTSVNDPSFALVRDSPFVVFNKKLGLDMLGSAPTFEDIFTTEPVVHEAPIYVPELNALIVSQFSPDILDQVFINLNNTPPTMEPFRPNPPIFGVNGGRFLNGTMYWAVAGGDAVVNGTPIVQAPGIYAIDPISRVSKPILNNYFGQRFNSPDDLVIDSAGDIFFTDPQYAFQMNLSQFPPVLNQQTYRFRPCTGEVSLIEGEIGIPNGIALSPDEKTMYISDTAVTDFVNHAPDVGFSYKSNAPKAVYAFDTVESPAGKYLLNKRPLWYPSEFGADGLHVSEDGYIIGATGASVDIVTPDGELVLKIQANYTVVNVQFAGPDLDELWLFGIGKISKAKLNLRGLAGGRS